MEKPEKSLCVLCVSVVKTEGGGGMVLKQAFSHFFQEPGKR